MPCTSYAKSDTLIVGCSVSPPFIIENDKGELSGISVWLWNAVAEDMGIKYKYEVFELQVLIDKIQNSQVDVSINPLSITSERMQKFYFSSPFFASNSTVLINRESAWTKGMAFLKSIFSVNFFRVIGAMMVVILFFGTLTWLFERKDKASDFEHGLKGLWSGFWWSAVTMTTVGYGDKSPKTVGGRIVALIWMFTAIITISGFTAGIASSLTVNQLSSSIISLDNLKSEKIGTVDKSATQKYLKSNFFKNVKGFSDIQSGVEALEREEVKAFLYDEPILTYLVKSKEKTELEILSIKFDKQFYAFAISPKSKDLREKISQSITSISETNKWSVVLSEYGLEHF
ncbi:MAG: transporter substrate-binding domain-containing protein [Bacteroidia bacterium]|nr:transporter substrate-binding domain-containing protein [Bacteroidia bacterium]